MRKILSVLLAVLLLTGASIPVLAADEPAPTDDALLDPNELSSIMDEFRQARGLEEYNFSVAYCYTGTGETWYYNEDKYFDAASLYKLPLMMCLARELNEGKLSLETDIHGSSLQYILENTLLYSNNNTADKGVAYYQPYRNYRDIIGDLAEIPEEDRPEAYYDRNIVSARFMLNVLKKLYENPEEFPHILDYMKQAQPGEFFRMNLGNQYEIAQKYGAYTGIAHTAGIVYTSTPFLAVVMTQFVDMPREVIADVAVVLADYTQTLDQRLAQRQAEEQAAAEKAEQERLAEEARIKAEQEAAEQARLEAEAAAQKAAEEAAALAEAQRLQAEQEAAERLLKIKIVCIAILSIALIIAAIVATKKYKRK